MDHPIATPTASVAGSAIRMLLTLTALLLSATGLWALWHPEPARAGTRTLQLGFLEASHRSADPAVRRLWLDRTVAAGADLISLPVLWRNIALREPADPADPADPAYGWERLDSAVRDARERGLRVMMPIRSAPAWAEGPDRDPAARPGTWKPDPDRLARFATAVARRYSGRYPDPTRPDHALPRVRLWEIWEEPNLAPLLSPQWEPRGDGWRLASARHYRRMLNAAYAAIKGVRSSNTVSGGATSPFGDSEPGGARVSPVRFWRQVLCLRGKRLHKSRCPGGPARLDALASNPLAGVQRHSPWTPAAAAGDVIVPDMRKLRRIIRAARARGTIKPRKGTELWAPEVYWETNPPDSIRGVGLDAQADYFADTLFLLWRQGVSKVFWVQVRDQPVGESIASLIQSIQSGIYFENGLAKPAAQASRFPFVAVRTPKGGTRIWGRSPAVGKVRIQLLSDRKWRPLTTLRTGRSRVFSGIVHGNVRGQMRAVIEGEASLPRRPRAADRADR